MGFARLEMAADRRSLCVSATSAPAFCVDNKTTPAGGMELKRNIVSGFPQVSSPILGPLQRTVAQSGMMGALGGETPR